MRENNCKAPARAVPLSRRAEGKRWPACGPFRTTFPGATAFRGQWRSAGNGAHPSPYAQGGAPISYNWSSVQWKMDE
jgi:hypothetical protein